jgi:hypothetical protein
MAGIDFEAAAKAAIRDVDSLVRNEEFNKNRIAADIGQKIAKNRDADVMNDSDEFRRSEAKLAGITAALDVFLDYCARGKPPEGTS